MKVGITGTRNGCTIEQLRTLEMLLRIFRPTELHHGDCVGVDAQAAQMTRDMFGVAVRIVCHPPIDDAHRAWTKCNDETREPLRHFARNRAIVDECDALIAVPMQAEHQDRGGTWYTYDYAMRKRRPVSLIKPDGIVAEAWTAT